MNDNAMELAVYAAAATVPGADAPELCNSVSFMKAVQALDPDRPGFVARVANATRTAVDADQRFRAAATTESAQTPSGPRQWTMDDVGRASTTEMTEAMDAGLMRDLGYGPRRGGARS